MKPDGYDDETNGFREEYVDFTTQYLDSMYSDDYLLKVGKSMADDLDDGINHQYTEPFAGVTAQSSFGKRFRVIPEE